MSKLKFYIDENVPTEVTEQLTLKGIDAVSVRNLNLLGDEDSNHLERATKMGYILCTHDKDFTRLARQVSEHAGIAFAPQYGSSVGGWVKALIRLYEQISAEEAKGQLIFLSLKGD